MSLSRAILSLLASSLAPTHASPHSLYPRAPDGTPTTAIDAGTLEGKIIYFSPDWPTCGNDHYLTDLGLKTTTEVAVRQDCDPVIETICTTAIAQMKFADLDNSLSNVVYTVGTCEGHLLFPDPENVAAFTKDECVAAFQSVSTMCMLLDQPGQWDRYGSVGSQFGVKNVNHRPRGEGIDPTIWVAPQSTALQPGYMLGPPGVFGTVIGKNANGFNADGSLKPSPRSLRPRAVHGK